VDRPRRPAPDDDLVDDRWTEERLLDVAADALAASPPTLDVVVAAGREAWRWRSMMELLQSVTGHLGEAPGVSTAARPPD
jgi:hypothetical protein